MSEKALLAMTRPDGSWIGRHVQWLAAGWALPLLHEAIEARQADGMGLRSAMEAVWAEDIAPGVRYDRWPDPDAPRSGWGKVSSRHNAVAEDHLYLHVVALDPLQEQIVVRHGQRCEQHASLLRGTRLTGWVDAPRAPEAGAACPWGRASHQTQRAHPSGGRRPYVGHRPHAVPGCDCWCNGWTAWRYEETYRYGAGNGDFGRAVAVASEHPNDILTADTFAGEALSGGALRAECWARLVLDGTDPARALSLASCLASPLRA